ncbi:viroplasmin family protein [Weissella diestrammenae]|uniref:ribonuclease H n=1 Tax=Weissella diestrammenae TaxID=1162633 RepID=A0A7G9T775_9LACO|nr:viroplasmin family protein [Weissella diestrammenae]MCM0582447.1 viroplasmin family protein [Weissella diestrammenae]QNN75950.1 viroplasmin family protein [Weissella diestrammenae]
MKSYVIIGNQYEGIYTQPWSEIKAYTQTKPAPKYKGFETQEAAETWFKQQKNAEHGGEARTYQTAYDGKINWQPDRYYIFTDGGSRNTGNVVGGHVKATDKAGWAIAVFQGNDMKNPVFTDSGAYYGKTNNEMEIFALINALTQALKVPEKVVIVSDSKYVLDTTTDWMYSWQANGWKKKSGPIANLAAWQMVYDLVIKQAKRLQFIWVKGHATSTGNVLVDELLNQAMDGLTVK